MINGPKPSVCSYIPGLIVLGSIEKQVAQAMWSKTVTCTSISSCLQLLALCKLSSLFWMTNCYMELSEINPFLHKLLLLMVCH